MLKVFCVNFKKKLILCVTGIIGLDSDFFKILTVNKVRKNNKKNVGSYLVGGPKKLNFLGLGPHNIFDLI